jgi:hypothetical protein
MTDTKTKAMLQKVISREARSILQYVSEAFPWTTPEERPALEQLQLLIAEEREALGRVIDLYTDRFHTYPPIGSFPTAFTEINYVSLEHLLPMLVDYEARSLGELECEFAEITDTQVMDVLQTLLDVKCRHLEVLKKLEADHPETLSTVR